MLENFVKEFTYWQTKTKKFLMYFWSHSLNQKEDGRNEKFEIENYLNVQLNT